MPIPIQNLHTFSVIARLGSMQMAAHEIGVTPGAISQRMRALEEQHGSRLFKRSREGVQLTSAGKQLWQQVGEAFATIEAAHRDQFCPASSTRLRISVAPTFAHSFLVGNLDTFHAAHPRIKLSIETDDRLVDLRTEPVDLAIRHGLGEYLGLRSDWLCAPELIVVGNPALLDKHPLIESPVDCLRLPLLPGETGADWSLWFEAQGVRADTATYGSAFDDGFLTVKAAVRGHGLALVNDIYVRDELADGTLKQVLPGSWPTKFAYYAVTRTENSDRPSIKAFIAWLKGAVSTSSATE